MWAVLVGGYISLSRDFAYIGVAPLYIGEAYLGYSILQNKRNWVSRFIGDCMHFRLLPLAIGLHASWGIIEVARSLMLQRSLVDSLRTAAFNYYPMYLLVGITIGATLQFAYFLRVVKWLVGIFAVRSFLMLCNIEVGGLGLSSITAVFLLAVWSELKAWKWRHLLLALCLFPVFYAGTHGRSGVIGLFGGMLAIAVSSRKQLIEWSIWGGAAFVVLMLVGPRIPGPAGGAPPLDPVVEIARVVASDHPDLAIRIVKWRAGRTVTGAYRDEIDNITNVRGTAAWRQIIWRRAIGSLNTPTLQLLGKGEGISIQDLTPDGQDIRSPHNIAIYCLYYTGYVGLAIFGLLFFAMWNTGTMLEHPVLRRLYSASFWSMLLLAITGNCLETPFGAIPFYLFQGVVIGLGQKLAAEARYVRLWNLAERERSRNTDDRDAQPLVPAYAQRGAL
jgi:hypothetical protein